MNRYQCPKCNENQYSSSDKKSNEVCIYCGNQGINLMKDIEEKDDKDEKNIYGQSR